MPVLLHFGCTPAWVASGRREYAKLACTGHSRCSTGTLLDKGGARCQHPPFCARQVCATSRRGRHTGHVWPAPAALRPTTLPARAPLCFRRSGVPSPADARPPPCSCLTIPMALLPFCCYCSCLMEFHVVHWQRLERAWLNSAGRSRPSPLTSARVSLPPVSQRGQRRTPLASFLLGDCALCQLLQGLHRAR